MNLTRLSLLTILILMLVGCGVSKKLSRQYDPFRPVDRGAKTCLEASSNAFSGKLKLLYEKKIKGSPNSPIQFGNGVLSFMTSRQRVLIFRQDDGHRICRIKKSKGFSFDPVMTDSLIVLVRKSPYGRIEIRNLFSGKTLADRDVNQIRSGPILYNNRLIAGLSDGLLCLSFPGLEHVWEKKTDAIVDVMPVTDDSHIYFSSGAGRIYAVSVVDGVESWMTDCGSGLISQLSLGRALYLGLADGRMTALEKETGRILWQRQLEQPMLGTVTECGGRLYFGAADKKIHCWSADDGTPVWEFETGGVVTAQPIIVDRAVIIGSQDRVLYCLNKDDGTLLDRHSLEGPVTHAAAVQANRIFVTCRANRLYCFEGY